MTLEELLPLLSGRGVAAVSFVGLTGLDAQPVAAILLTLDDGRRIMAMVLCSYGAADVEQFERVAEVAPTPPTSPPDLRPFA